MSGLTGYSWLIPYHLCFHHRDKTRFRDRREVIVVSHKTMEFCVMYLKKVEEIFKLYFLYNSK
jgi:hypothetical protein